MRLFTKFLGAFACAALIACTSTPAPQLQARQATVAEPFVIAANPLAAEAGLNVLKRGGSAVDAAIAIQAMLSLVEPQSSGVGGGAFMTYFDARTGKLTVYDGREVAPAQATSDMFLDPSGKPLPFKTAVVSGRATGVPGASRCSRSLTTSTESCRGAAFLEMPSAQPTKVSPFRRGWST